MQVILSVGDKKLKDLIAHMAIKIFVRLLRNPTEVWLNF